MAQQIVKPAHQPREPDSSGAIAPSVPPLENGDRLTRAEFERRYEAMPQLTRRCLS